MDVEELAEFFYLEIENALPLSVSGASAGTYFIVMIAHVLGSKDVSQTERSELEKRANLFVQDFGKIVATGQSELKEAALEALSSMLFVSLHFAGGPVAYSRLKTEIDKNRTKSANDARRQPQIRDIELAPQNWTGR